MAEFECLGPLKLQIINKARLRESLQKIEFLKEQLVAESISQTGENQGVSLNKEKIENYLGKTIGESSWSILLTLYNSPSIGNKELADQVHLSVSGLRSSLSRLYKHFKVDTENTQSKKVAMLSQAIKISLGQQ